MLFLDVDGNNNDDDYDDINHEDNDEKKNYVIAKDEISKILFETLSLPVCA